MKEAVRDLKDGGWYWIDKTILRIYGKKLMASGIAVYNALASFSNSKTQVCFPAQKTIAELIGVSRRTVIRKIKLLAKFGLIRVDKKKGRCFYCLVRQLVSNNARGCVERDTSNVTSGNTNKNYLTIINNKNNDYGNRVDSNVQTLIGFIPKTKEELLALDLAKGLNDMKNLNFYLSISKKYPEEILRKLYGQVKEIPKEKIKKSKGALFTYLLKTQLPH